jgi:hypothetical protein
MLLELLKSIPDHRRGQGRMYALPYVILFSILAIIGGAKSYRQVHSFIKTHRSVLNEHFNIKWRRAPAYTTIRGIIQNTNKDELEKAFRQHAGKLVVTKDDKHITFDGKVVRGSFDNFEDKKAIQILSALLVQDALILGHETINEKTNEIPVSRKMIKDLGLKGCIVSADALHCQKKR